MEKNIKNIKDIENMSFETAYENLISLVEEIENSHLDLNSVIANYRQATELLKYCQNLLDKARLEISKISPTEFAEN